jgi:hypothetical protein
MTNEAVWTLPVTAAVELKHWMIGERVSRFAREFSEDLVKLQNYASQYQTVSTTGFTGIACLFVQSYAPNALAKLTNAGLVIGAPWTYDVSSGITGVVVSLRDGARLASARV